MRRLFMALSMVLALGLAQAIPAAAGNEWCSQDPVVQLLGSQFHVTTRVAAPASSVDSISYVVEVPANATDAVAHFSQGKRLPSTVSFEYTGAAYDGTSATFSVRVRVLVTAAAEADVLVEVSGRSVSRDTVPGQTGESISFELDVAAK